MKKTFKEAGYRYIMHEERGTHVLWNTATRNFERWFSNKGHVSYGLKYKNTHLEYASDYSEQEKTALIRSMRAIQNFGEQHDGFHSPLMRAYRECIA